MDDNTQNTERSEETTLNNTEPQTRTTQPSRMNRRAVMLTIALFLLVVFGMFIFAFVQQDDAPQNTDNNDEQTADDRYSDITRIDAKHFYENGVHTLVGEVAMPTPCDLLETDARVAESMPEQITVEFDVVNNAEFCAEVITPARFKVSVQASENATFAAEFEGRRVELNLLDPEPGETPEDFELFIKG